MTKRKNSIKYTKSVRDVSLHFEYLKNQLNDYQLEGILLHMQEQILSCRFTRLLVLLSTR